MCIATVSTRTITRAGAGFFFLCAIVYSLVLLMFSKSAGCSQGDPVPALAFADPNPASVQVALDQPGRDFDGILDGDSEVRGYFGKSLFRLGRCANGIVCFHVLQKIVSTKFYK